MRNIFKTKIVKSSNAQVVVYVEQKYGKFTVTGILVFCISNKKTGEIKIKLSNVKTNCSSVNEKNYLDWGNACSLFSQSVHPLCLGSKTHLQHEETLAKYVFSYLLAS